MIPPTPENLPVPKPSPKDRAAIRRQRLREKSAAKRERQKVRVAKRKERRATKAAPRLALRDWSMQVRAEFGDKCAVCGIGAVEKLSRKGRKITVGLHSHHLIPKERFAEHKLNVMNGICLCPTHHKFGAYSFHRHPMWAMMWLQKHHADRSAWVMGNVDSAEL